MKLYVIQDETSKRYWKGIAKHSSLAPKGWALNRIEARFYNSYGLANGAKNNMNHHLSTLRTSSYATVKTAVEAINLKVMVLDLTLNSFGDTDYMEYKTSSKSLVLITPTEFEIIPPNRVVSGKTYFDVPPECIAVEIEREKIKDSRSKKKKKVRIEPKVLGLKVMVRYEADLNRLDRVITIAQEHNVFITDYKVESMKMLRQVSTTFDGYNNLKTKLDNMELGLDNDLLI